MKPDVDFRLASSYLSDSNSMSDINCQLDSSVNLQECFWTAVLMCFQYTCIMIPNNLSESWVKSDSRETWGDWIVPCYIVSITQSCHNLPTLSLLIVQSQWPKRKNCYFCISMILRTLIMFELNTLNVNVPRLRLTYTFWWRLLTYKRHQSGRLSDLQVVLSVLEFGIVFDLINAASFLFLRVNRSLNIELTEKNHKLIIILK